VGRTGSGVSARQTENDFWPADRPERKGPPKLLIIAAALLGLAVAGTLAVVLLTGGEDKNPAAARPVLPTVYTPALANKETARLGKRAADPRPLTAGEVFTPRTKTVTYRNYSFTLANSEVSADCKAVTWGARLQQDLQRHGCNQILRGAYVSADKRHAGQFIAVNLSDQAGAEQIVRDLNPDSDAGFVLPLTAPGTAAFGGGFSAAYAQTFGHYAVVTWVQRAGGAQPASLNEMIDVSLAVEKPGDFVWSRLQLLPGADGQG
jgi:hypothetical protein